MGDLGHPDQPRPSVLGLRIAVEGANVDSRRLEVAERDVSSLQNVHDLREAPVPELGQGAGDDDVTDRRK